MVSGIMADKFVEDKIPTESAILTEKIPKERILGDKILTSYKNSIAPIRRCHLLNDILLLRVTL